MLHFDERVTNDIINRPISSDVCPADEALGRSFSAAVAAYEAAELAHDQAVTEYGVVEARRFADEIAEDDPALLAADDKVDQVADAAFMARDLVFRTPVTNYQDAAQKADIAANYLREGKGPTAPKAAMSPEAAWEIAKRNLALFAPQPDHDRSLWDAAVDDYYKAEAAHEAARIAWIANLDKDKEDGSTDPRLLRPGLHYPNSLRWQRVEDVNEDLRLSPDQKAELRPIVAERERAQDLARETENATDDPIGDAMDVACEIVEDALDDISYLPAPDAKALVLKSALRFWRTDDDKLGFDDLGLVAFLRGHYLTDRLPVDNHTDLLRVAGVDHPMLSMDEFVPHEWVKAYEHGEGLVSRGLRELIILHPSSAGERFRTKGLLDELYACTWKARAVFLFAGARVEDGGDPLMNSHWDREGGTTRGGWVTGRKGARLGVRRSGDVISFYTDAAGAMQMFIDPILDPSVI